MSNSELNVAGVVNEPLETMIPAPSESLSFHGSMISADIVTASPSQDGRRRTSQRASTSQGVGVCGRSTAHESTEGRDAEHKSKSPVMRPAVTINIIFRGWSSGATLPQAASAKRSGIDDAECAR